MRAKWFLQILFAAIFVWMVILTTRTSLQISIWEVWDSYAANPWAVATLWDAYFGFLFFFLWVFYKERRWGLRLLWFVLIMGLGNIAMSLYAFLAIRKLSPEEPAEAMLLRRA
jgi:hypothetical protein